jgi:hypothetical protein
MSVDALHPFPRKNFSPPPRRLTTAFQSRLFWEQGKKEKEKKNLFFLLEIQLTAEDTPGEG